VTATQPPERQIAMDPVVFRAHPSGDVELIDPASLFDKAGGQFRDKQFAAAAATFDRVATDYPDSHFVVPSLYNAGLALEQAGDLAGAVARYRRITVEHADDKDVLDAWFRLGRTQADARRFADAAQTWNELLARKDLGFADRIEVMARRGFALFSQKELLPAERTFREQLAYYKAHESQERLESDFFLGMSAYYLGEVAHEQYRALPVRLPEKQMSRDLEAKARLLLVAQARFVDAMRVNNTEWATAAGFQIGSLYREFYDDLVGAPIPPSLNGEAREIYLDEVKKHVRTLLQKAISVHEKNIMMAERVGEKNDWVRRSNEQMDQLRKLLVPGPLPPAEAAPTPSATPAAPLPRPRDEVHAPVMM
jgi:tetratricopeptide (TPR) repeat protein